MVWVVLAISIQAQAKEIAVVDQIILSGQAATLTAEVTSSVPFEVHWYDLSNPLNVDADLTNDVILHTGITFTTPVLTVTTTYKVVATDNIAPCDHIVTVLVANSLLKSVNLFNNDQSLVSDPPILPEPLPNPIPPLVEPLPYTNPFWETGEEEKPVAYRAGTNFGTQANIEIAGLTNIDPSDLNTILGKIQIEATFGAHSTTTIAGATQNFTYHVPNPASAPTITENILTSSQSTTTEALTANRIDYYDTFESTWRISFDQGITWQTLADHSENTVYVRLGTNSPTNPYNTVFYLSCKNAAGMVVTDVDIVAQTQPVVDKIYGEFVDKDVRRLGTDILLGYYKNPQINSTNISSLLYLRDGRCGAWTRFFEEMLKVQGLLPETHFTHIQIKWRSDYHLISEDFTSLDADKITVGIPSCYQDYSVGVDIQPAYFFINNWFKPEPHSFHAVTIVGGGDQDITIADDIDGLAAQAMANPRSYFADHALVKFNNKYYDPSYGSLYNNSTPDNPLDDVPYPDAASWENQNVTALGGRLMSNGSGVCTLPDMDPQLMWFKELNNPAELDLIGY